jgi:Domain of unknown function (DUF4407)
MGGGDTGGDRNGPGDTWLLADTDDRTVELAVPDSPAPWLSTRAHPADGPEVSDPPEAPALVRRQLRNPAPRPARRFALFASGVDSRVLAYVPIEQSDFVIQGTLVILTALVAAISGLAASSFLLAGRFMITPVTVLIGLFWAALIFFFDRALVSGTFNPYHFSRGQIASLRDAPADSVWQHVTDGDVTTRHAVLARLGEVVRVLLVATLRIALAVATSFIAAEMVLFLVFAPEITQRAGYIEQQNQAQRIAQIQADGKAQAAQRSAQRAQLSGVADPDVLRLRTRAATITTQLANARKDLEVLQSAAAAERDGLPFAGKLTDGTPVTSTGMRGDGAASHSLQGRRAATQKMVDTLSARLDQTDAAIDARIAAVKTTNAAALATLATEDRQAAGAEQAAITAASGDPGSVRGLLIRQAALNQLVNDRKPDTVVPDPLPHCSNVLCRLHRFLLPPTPMGPFVVAFRVIFFVIEILPITFKVISSLRLRRPYDAVKAAFEEAAVADAVRLADRQLHEASAEMGARVRLRHAGRRGGAGPPSGIL